MSDSGKLLEATTSNDRRSDTNTSRIRSGMGLPEDVLQKVGKLLSESQRKLISSFANRCLTAAKDSNGRWIQDVLLCETPRHAEELVREIQGYVGGYGRSVLFITSHDSHVHINHDCPYAGGSCRCFWRKKTAEAKNCEFRRRLLRPGGRRRVRDLQLSDWLRIILYFTTEGRRTATPYIDGQVSIMSYIYDLIILYI